MEKQRPEQEECNFESSARLSAIHCTTLYKKSLKVRHSFLLRLGATFEGRLQDPLLYLDDNLFITEIVGDF